MSKKKVKYIKQSFESKGFSSDTSANIYESMLKSDAWFDLTATQKVLFLVCKAQYYCQKKKPDGNRFRFTMNRNKWLNEYKLYSEGNQAGFYRDMEALIEKGFIKCEFCGAFTRTRNIYEYSDKWRLYKTPEFMILPTEMTLRMQRKLKKE